MEELSGSRSSHAIWLDLLGRNGFGAEKWCSKNWKEAYGMPGERDEAWNPRHIVHVQVKINKTGRSSAQVWSQGETA